MLGIVRCAICLVSVPMNMYIEIVDLCLFLEAAQHIYKNFSNEMMAGGSVYCEINAPHDARLNTNDENIKKINKMGLYNNACNLKQQNFCFATCAERLYYHFGLVTDLFWYFVSLAM